MEEWLSGRKHSSRKAAGSQGSRGFESLLFRHVKLTTIRHVASQLVWFTLSGFELGVVGGVAPYMRWRAGEPEGSTRAIAR